MGPSVGTCSCNSKHHNPAGFQLDIATYLFASHPNDRNEKNKAQIDRYVCCTKAAQKLEKLFVKTITEIKAVPEDITASQPHGKAPATAAESDVRRSSLDEGALAPGSKELCSGLDSNDDPLDSNASESEAEYPGIEFSESGTEVASEPGIDATSEPGSHSEVASELGGGVISALDQICSKGGASDGNEDGSLST